MHNACIIVEIATLKEFSSAMSYQTHPILSLCAANSVTTTLPSSSALSAMVLQLSRISPQVMSMDVSVVSLLIL